MLEIRGQRILLRGMVVGVYCHYKSLSIPSKQVLSMFDPMCCRVIRKMTKRHPVINYVWVSDIAIRPKWRRQGLASQVLNRVSDNPRTLVACAPGSGVKGGMRMNAESRLDFYRSLGFTLVIGDKHDYAFKFTP